MIKLMASELLKKRGESRYWLNKGIGMSTQNLNKMLDNKTRSIKYENIETMCLMLECTPNELLKLTDD